MENISYKILKDTLIINSVKKEFDIKNLNNTNIIDVKDLKFSINYIQQNQELVTNFINVIILKKNITTVLINDTSISEVALSTLTLSNNIKKIIFNDESTITISIVVKLLEIPSITDIECHEMSQILIDRLDFSNHIKVKTRINSNYTSLFMGENFINNYSDIYNKKAIIISGTYELKEYEELKIFMNFNSKLKNIKIYTFSNELLAVLLEELEKTNKRNVNIIIYEKNNDLKNVIKSVTFLKKNYKKYLEKNNINFKIKYSNDYKSANFIKEFNLKYLVTIIFICLIFISILALYNAINLKKDEKELYDQVNEINNIIDKVSVTSNIETTTQEIQETTEAITTTTTVAVTPEYVKPYYENYSHVISSLKEINSDTVGWITVNNTKVNYPVVQTTDNSFYLTHTYNKLKNTMGWVFMDYRNDPINLNKNTILYGHNVKNGWIFGSLKYTLNNSWYTKEENQIITFNNEEKEMKWKIFSIYRIETTTDYIQTKFSSDEEFTNFINLIKDRSIYDFGVSISPENKILTLSTCYTNTTKTVLHAVLIEE